jgi:hypothetical protein
VETVRLTTQVIFPEWISLDALVLKQVLEVLVERLGLHTERLQVRILTWVLEEQEPEVEVKVLQMVHLVPQVEPEVV